ncbi:MFS transporter [Coleofasciculus sp. FACHB-64]|uniref:MFS transporter n=1 Tax=Cyanophyceae TaxID=3028117 RepID=UPI001687BB5B|nr:MULTISPECIES: MFS transporter [unclassified Coleofasciculus]MBD1841715.1 MFS transporter [Coleofasciculus sp. FACHB-501]MBD2049141.1 MFS transporter [Coleofasciculus sp. FACHB-64]
MNITTKKNAWKLESSAPLWFFAFVPYKIGEGLLIILMPLFIIQVVGGTVADVAKVNSLIALVGMFAFILWGNLSDKMGYRTPFLILGFLGFTLCISMLSFSDNLSQVLILGSVGGFFMATITPVGSALVLDSFPEQEWPKFFGKFYQVTGWSFVASVLFGMLWLNFASKCVGNVAAMRGLLLFAGVVSSLSLLLCFLWVKEPKFVRKRRKFNPKMLGQLTVGVIERRAVFYPSRALYFVLRPSSLSQAVQPLGSPLGRYYLCSLLFFVAINLVIVPFPVFLTNTLKATNTQVFLIALVKSTIESWLYVPVGHWVHQRPGIKLQAQATALRGGVFGIFVLLALIPPQPSSLAFVGLAQILSGITWAAIAVSSSTAVGILAGKDKEGSAIGFYNAIIGASGALGSLGSGYLAATFGYSVCFGIGALLTAFTAWLLWQLQPVVLAKTS